MAVTLRYNALIWGSVVARPSKMFISVVAAASLPVSEIPLSIPISGA